MRCVGLCGTRFRLVEAQSHRLASAGCNSAGVVRQRGDPACSVPTIVRMTETIVRMTETITLAVIVISVAVKFFSRFASVISGFAVSISNFAIVISGFALNLLVCSVIIAAVGDATAGLLSVSRTDDDGLRDCKSVRCRRFGFALSPATACRSLPSRHITKETTTCGSGLFGVGYIVLLIIPAC